MFSVILLRSRAHVWVCIAAGIAHVITCPLGESIGASLCGVSAWKWTRTRVEDNNGHLKNMVCMTPFRAKGHLDDTTGAVWRHFIYIFFTSEESVTSNFNCIGFGCNTVYPWKCFVDSNTSPTPPSAQWYVDDERTFIFGVNYPLKPMLLVVTSQWHHDGVQAQQAWVVYCIIMAASSISGPGDIFTHILCLNGTTCPPPPTPRSPAWTLCSGAAH